MIEVIRYTDEADKSLGISGMAISLVGFDCENYLASVSLEPEDEPFVLGQEFFFSGNPRQSARIAWNEFLHQFQILSALAIGNVLCRTYAAGHAPDRRQLDTLREFVTDLGRDMCSLEDYEARNAFDQIYQSNERLFTHPHIIGIARSLSALLRVRRRMTAGEVIEQLSRLNSL